jgi:hypothetical protein
MIKKIKGLGTILSKEESKKVMGGFVQPICGTSGAFCNKAYGNADCCAGFVCVGPKGNTKCAEIA